MAHSAMPAGKPANSTTNHLSQISSDKLRAVLEAESAGQPSRKATVRVRGIAVMIDCPPWCVTDHSAENLAFLEDLSHYGAPIALTVPMFGGGTEKVLIAHLALWPFDGKGAYLALDADNSGEVSNLFEPAALAFADQLVAHAERIRAEVAKLSGGRS